MLIPIVALASIHAPAQPDKHCTAAQTKPFVSKVWSLDNWQRGTPKASTLTAYRKRLACAGPENRKAIKRQWQAARASYYEHRAQLLLRRRIEPYYGCTAGGCGRWAIPAVSVNCESGGGAVAGNIYGNLANYRGGSKWDQSIAAYELLQQNGGGIEAYRQVWLQWESGCDGWPWGY